MMSIQFKENEIPSIEQIIVLYQDASWFSYLREKDKVILMYQNSLDLITAWDDDTLVGLIRVVGDGLSILYIQDLLVLERYQSNKIGSTLLSMMLKKYENVRQIVLLSDINEKAAAFYRKNGFITAQDYKTISFVKMRS